MAASGIICRGRSASAAMSLLRERRRCPYGYSDFTYSKLPGVPQKYRSEVSPSEDTFWGKARRRGYCIPTLGALRIIESAWVRTKIFRSVPAPPPIRDGAALSPTKCPRLALLASGTSRGPRKSLYLSECEFVPVPNWLMGV